MKPQAPSQWRYLAELVRQLEEKEYARMQPLTPEDVIAAQRHTNLSSSIEALVKAAMEGVDGVTPVKHRGIRRGRYQTFAPTEVKWFSDSKSFGKTRRAAVTSSAARVVRASRVDGASLCWAAGDIRPVSAARG